MKYLKLFITASLFMICANSCENEIEQPNIVVFLCDDLGYGDLSTFGHQVIDTPNLDELASSGIKLTDCYAAAPVCSPSRAGLLTGRSPNRAGIYDFIPGPKNSEDCRDLVHLQEGEETIPAMLKSSGYSTCLVGKWHCSSKFNSDVQPKPDYFGFDHWFATHNNAVPSHENPKNFVRNGVDVDEIEGYSCQIIVNEAIDWLKKKESSNPFYLQVSFHEPHVPIASPKPLVDKYLPSARNEYEAQYFANVENVDLAVGRLIKYLENNYNENTLVIFTSDNGPETLLRYKRAKRSYGSPGALKGMKLWTNEAGFRVPGIVYWMGKSTYSGTSDAVVSSLDFLPTFAELAGSTLPNKPLDGESFTPLFADGKFERNKPLLWAFYNALNDHIIAMRYGDWKIMAKLKNDSTYLPKIKNVYNGNERLIKEAKLIDFVLFNMKEDKSEKSDLSKIKTDKFSEMRELLISEYDNLLNDSHVWTRM